MLILSRRKMACGLAAAVEFGAIGGGTYPAQAASFRKTHSFGGNGGKDFSLQYPSSVGLRTGTYVDAVLLNGSAYGGIGGADQGAFQLSPEDYWSDITIRSGAFVDYLSLRSRNGATLSGGGTGGVQSSLSGVRILEIGGRSGSVLDRITITFIENYQQSKVVDTNGLAILDFTPGGKTIETYEDKTSQTMQSFERITQSFLELTRNVSADGEYYAKFSTSTGIKISSTSTETIKNTAEETLKTGKKVLDTISDDQTAFLVAQFHLAVDDAWPGLEERMWNGHLSPFCGGAERWMRGGSSG